jgi:enoyl-CoA hydratase
MTGAERPGASAGGEAVQTARRGSILVITINRPASRNAVDVAAAELLAAAMAGLDSDPELAVGILAGAGSCFSAGMDLKAFAASGQRPVAAGRGFAGFVEQPPVKPLIAAVEGWALGGGLEMVLACDLVVASTTAQFGLPEVTRGLAARGGGAFRLPRRLPQALAMQVILTGQPMSAAQAARHGLINRLVPEGTALEAACELAGVVARNAPLAVRASKQVVNQQADWPLSECFDRQLQYFDPVFASADAAEGVAAFRDRRTPRWTGE